MSFLSKNDKPSVVFFVKKGNFYKWLKKSLKKLKNDFKITYIHDYESVSKYVSEKKVDIIFSELFMNDIDGIDFFDEIKREYPEIVRIFLADKNDKSFLLKAYDVSHQILDKISTPFELISTIERAFKIRKMLKNENLRKIINSIDSLPVLSDTYMRLIRAIQTPNISLKRIGAIIEEDASLTAKILQIANSPIYASHERVTTPYQATVLLGINTIKALIIFVTVFSSTSSNNVMKSNIKKKIESHSFKVAELTKEFVQRISKERDLLDCAFIGGLLHDFGKIILLELNDDYFEMLKKQEDINKTIIDKEIELLGTTHTEIGAYLLGIWGIPDNVIEAVLCHHQPYECQSIYTTVNSALHIANSLVSEGDFDDIYSLDTLSYDYLKHVHLKDRLPQFYEIYKERILGG